MRKSIDGLAALVQVSFRLDPFAPALFVFCNRQRNKLKILQWDHNGFWLYYRRLERGQFRWPQGPRDQATLVISPRQLRWLLDGLAATSAKPMRPSGRITWSRKVPKNRIIAGLSGIDRECLTYDNHSVAQRPRISSPRLSVRPTGA